MKSGLIWRVAIIGGTHGNELTGIYLVKKFEQFPKLLYSHSFECMTILANPQAIATNQRYIPHSALQLLQQEIYSQNWLRIIPTTFAISRIS